MTQVSGMHEDGQAKPRESVKCDQDPGEGSGWNTGRSRPPGSEFLLGSTLSLIQGLTRAMAFLCSPGVFLQQCRSGHTSPSRMVSEVPQAILSWIQKVAVAHLLALG